MIPYEDLVATLTYWRERNGLPTGAADYLGEPPAPTPITFEQYETPTGPAAEQVLDGDFVDEALLDEAIADEDQAYDAPLADAQPEFAEAQPEFADAQPEFAEAQPEFAEAQPEFAEAQPEFAEAQPEFAEAQPEFAEAEPEFAEAQPDLSEAQPEYAEAHADFSDAQPEYADALPEHADFSDAQPEYADALPEMAEPIHEGDLPTVDYDAEVAQLADAAPDAEPVDDGEVFIASEGESTDVAVEAVLETERLDPVTDGTEQVWGGNMTDDAVAEAPLADPPQDPESSEE